MRSRNGASSQGILLQWSNDLSGKKHSIIDSSQNRSKRWRKCRDEFLKAWHYSLISTNEWKSCWRLILYADVACAIEWRQLFNWFSLLIDKCYSISALKTTNTTGSDFFSRIPQRSHLQYHEREYLRICICHCSFAFLFQLGSRQCQNSEIQYV